MKFIVLYHNMFIGVPEASEDWTDNMWMAELHELGKPTSNNFIWLSWQREIVWIKTDPILNEY